MRLLNAHSLQLQSGFPDQILSDVKTQLWYQPSSTMTVTPKYAILSHRWVGEEITFRDFQSTRFDNVPLLNPVPFVAGEDAGDIKGNLSSIYKIAGACKQVRTLEDQGIKNLWIDTVCVNQGDSQEVSRSINSMFRWYQDAEVCLVYLFDVTWRADKASRRQFIDSEWFLRGWTLQELIAPKNVQFYDRNWAYIGTKDDLALEIAEASGIAPSYLSGSFRDASLAQRMSWLANRTTKHLEDRAYCVLGIFDIYLDTRYGSGEAEFVRLQAEICNKWDSTKPFDDSLFAWKTDRIQWSGLLAPAPGCFRGAGDILFIPALARLRDTRDKASSGVEVDGTGKTTLVVPFLGYIPVALIPHLLTFTLTMFITIGVSVAQTAKRKKEVRLNCWTRGPNKKLQARMIKMERGPDKTWRRVNCGNLYSCSTLKLYPSRWLSDNMGLELQVTSETKYKS